MSDFIKREDAMELINKCVSHTSPKAEAIDFDFRHGEINGLNWASDIIEAMPSADVAPVRHGRWVTTYQYSFPVWECSECGTQIGTANFAFCPCCGAKMDDDDK